jgi:hypothetical protein
LAGESDEPSAAMNLHPLPRLQADVQVKVSVLDAVASIHARRDAASLSL